MELHPVTIILGALGVIVLAALVATGIWCMDPRPRTARTISLASGSADLLVRKNTTTSTKFGLVISNFL